MSQLAQAHTGGDATCNSRQDGLMSQLLSVIQLQVCLIICETKLASRYARQRSVSRIIRSHVMASPFALSNRAADVRPGCKTRRIAPTLRQVTDLVYARTSEYFQTFM
ncbi:hypothetical protein PoB_003023500 [Plakobranchus ocellatus]|uniref:Uncharacterized protein n=1 Tax=Plakobranchus ocellatus TaxID=259542 RepID=A0AAV4A6E0_9GAST|nr:hypothetical protein PoB_003023500 [Plakobranchus ocellatus]